MKFFPFVLIVISGVCLPFSKILVFSSKGRQSAFLKYRIRSTQLILVLPVLLTGLGQGGFSIILLINPKYNVNIVLTVKLRLQNTLNNTITFNYEHILSKKLILTKETARIRYLLVSLSPCFTVCIVIGLPWQPGIQRCCLKGERHGSKTRCYRESRPYCGKNRIYTTASVRVTMTTSNAAFASDYAVCASITKKIDYYILIYRTIFTRNFKLYFYKFKG